MEINFYKNKSIITLAILLSISLLLMIFNVKFESFNIRKVFFFITYPIENSISAISGFFSNSFRGIRRINELEDELEDYKERLIAYQEKLLLYSEIQEENEELKQLLDVKEDLDYDSVYAKVIYRDPSLLGDFYIIDKGSSDDLEKNMPVVSSDSNGNVFLVGKIVEVTLNASKVKVLTSKSFYLGVSLQGSGYVGILNGNGSWNQNCEVNYIPVEANAFTGQEVETSGESDIFPDGIPVGKISALTTSVMEEFFYTLYIKPMYNYSTVDHVFIIDWEPAAEANILIEDTYE